MPEYDELVRVLVGGRLREARIVVVHRPNIGLSYGAYSDASGMFRRRCIWSDTEILSLSELASVMTAWLLARAVRSSTGDSTDRWTNAPMRYQVAVVEPGERVMVHGLVGSDVAPSRPHAGSGYRGGPRYALATTRRVLRAPPGGRLILAAFTARDDGGVAPRV